MRAAVVGGGILGLTLAHRLTGLGHSVELFEAAPELGGLACKQDYGAFTWDRFYHCILPQDQALIGLLGEIGLGDELRWRTTGTGYWKAGRFYPMSGNADFVRFPLLSFFDKARLGAAIVYATRFADPFQLYRVTAAEWLTKTCGRRVYEVFWRPLLKAKFGTFHDQVAAVFIWATLTRLFGARTGGGQKEQLGYAHGGYARILGALSESLTKRGVVIRLGASVTRVHRSGTDGAGSGSGCSISWTEAGGKHDQRTFDQVFFTAPTRLAERVVSGDFEKHVSQMAKDFPTSHAYLGVACAVLALKKPLTPYYVLNIGDETVELTGLIEMTNLVDPAAETQGRSLIYLPRYLGADDERLSAPDADLLESLIGRGLKTLFPDFRDSDIDYVGVHRARYVQPLPLVGAAPPDPKKLAGFERPFQIVNTSMLTCATLNNNEVVSLVDNYVERHRAALVQS